MLCLEGASANKVPTPFQSLKIEKSASKTKKNGAHKHERHEAVPFFSWRPLVLRLHLNRREHGTGEEGRKAHSRVRAFHHLSSRSSLFAGSLLLSRSELKIDFPKKAPFRWSHQGNLY